MERNKSLERDGLYWESETHEWFHDKISTRYAVDRSVLWGSGEQNDSLNVACFVVRNKETGEYDRVMLDTVKNEIIFDTKSLIPILKGRFKIKNPFLYILISSSMS